MKKVLALLMAAITLSLSLVGCGSDDDATAAPEENIDKGAEITMYLGDFPNDLDPGRVYFNEDMQKYYSLLYEGLTTIDTKGKVQPGLAKDWEYEVDERDDFLKLVITMDSTNWSDGIAVDADDVVYAFKRLLSPANSNPAASLLYPIYNAKAAKSGLVTIDDVGFSAINAKTVEIIFEKDFTDVEYFLRTLASPVLTPLREDVITSNGEDWAQPLFLKKKRWADDAVSTIVTNGPFLIKTWNEDYIVLERSTYYRALKQEQKLTTYVNPYRLIINFTKNLNDQVTNFNNVSEFFVADFTADGYTANASSIQSVDNLSTYTYYFNANNKTLKDARVRKALSIALDRNEIVRIVGGGVKPATGYVPTGVEGVKKTFREENADVISASANLEEAKKLLKEAGVSSGSLTITIADDREWEEELAKYAASVWKELGIKASVDTLKTASTAKVTISAFETALASGDFDIIGFDLAALSTDAYSFVVPYAREYSGSVVPVDDDAEPSSPHVTGFDDEEYNALFENIIAAKDAAERNAVYAEAEKMLAEKVPSAPLFFGVNSSLISDKLTKVENDYFGNPVFTKAKLKDYEKYKVSTDEEDED